MDSMSQNAITIERAECGGWLVRALVNGMPGRLLLASDDAATVADFACSVTGIQFEIDDAAGADAKAAAVTVLHNPDHH